MARWTCPRCDRQFGRARQSHDCVPGNSVAATFAPYDPEHRKVYDEIIGHVRSLGPVHEDAVQVGVFLKSDHKLAEVRPKVRSVRLTVYLPWRLTGERVSRVYELGHDRYVNEIPLRGPDDVDDWVREQLTAAYEEATE